MPSPATCFSSYTFWNFLRFLLGVTICCLAACQPAEVSHSELFQQLFRNDTAAFRGVDPGDPIKAVLRQEDDEHLLHQDELGLSYRVLLASKQELLIDYHSDNLRTEAKTDEIASIIAHLNFEDEVTTAKLYSEIQKFLVRKYGVAAGLYGNYTWEGLTRHLTRMEVRLRIADDKRGLALSFVDTEPEPNDSLYSGILLDSMGRPLPPLSTPAEE